MPISSLYIYIYFIIIVLISIFCFGTVIHFRKKSNQYHLYIIKWLLHHHHHRECIPPQPPSRHFTCMSHKQCSKIDFLYFILFHFLDRKCKQMQWVKTVLMGSSYKTGSQNRLLLWTKISNTLMILTQQTDEDNLKCKLQCAKSQI